MQPHLFDKVVASILLHWTEIWGHENIDITEKLQPKFWKILLTANNSTCKCMVFLELGRYSLQMYADQRMLHYWVRIINAEDKQLKRSLYQIIHDLDNQGVLESG